MNTSTTASTSVVSTFSIEAFDHRRDVVGDVVGDVGREEVRQLLHLVFDRARGRQRVAGRRQQHGEARGRLAVEARVELVAQAADLDPRDVAQPHGRAVGIGAQDDGAEFIRRGELALDQHQRGDLAGPRVLGSAPMLPEATWAFCAAIALLTSSAVRP